MRDKFELERVAATLVVALPMALVSVLFLGTTSGLHVLDIVDHFINQFGILLVAVVSMVVVVWGLKALPSWPPTSTTTPRCTSGCGGAP